MTVAPSSRRSEVSRLLCVDVLAEWLVERFTHAQLAAEGMAVFLRSGPALPRALRLDLKHLFEDSSATTLARYVAMNEDPCAREEFVAWCRGAVRETDDPYERFGIGREDFCGDRGPGFARGR